jgi:hypothetical protein
MIDSSSALYAGLQEHCKKVNQQIGGSFPYQLGCLQTITASLIEGDTREKQYARIELKRLIGRGRCILNAADLAKKKTDKSSLPGGINHLPFGG